MNRCAICKFRLEVSNQKTCSAPCQTEYRRRKDREAKARRRARQLLEAKVKAPKLESEVKAPPLDNCVGCLRVERDELRDLLTSLRDWKSPDGVLQVKALHCFKALGL